MLIGCALADAYRLHTLPPRHRPLQVGTHRGDVRAPPASPGAPHKTGSPRAVRSLEAARGGRGDGELASVHGDAGRAEGRRDDDHELYVGRYAEAGEDAG